jgi:acyl-CoA hydrolase/RimJ/RimL family protein N-acetyltransferase
MGMGENDMRHIEKHILFEIRNKYKKKFVPESVAFDQIQRGDRIFVGTGCGEPQYLIRALMEYVETNPKAFFDAEVVHVWTLGVAPYTEQRFSENFRHNSFFIGNDTRTAVNEGLADYTPIFLSQVPDLFYRGLIPIQVALIQVSPPDDHGYMSLGVSLDIVRAAVDNARVVVAQVNSYMPRVHGDGFIHIEDVNYIIEHNEPLLEYGTSAPDDITQQIGEYVARIIEDGDTIQVGYGNMTNAILSSLINKKHLGIHTDLLTEGMVELMKKGVVDNSMKTINRYKTIATLCMGKKETYDYIDDNPEIEFKTIDYTDNPMIIAQHKNMAAINSALEIDLTGQATAESIGKTFYSGMGGHADFMRGAVMAPGGKPILIVQSTAENGEISRIVPFLKEGAGTTMNRGDIHYVVTEYGIAYLHGKNIRERAMELISISHPKFRPYLIEEAKKLNLVYRDQTYIDGAGGEYPERLETHRTAKSGLNISLRPVKISDEPLLKDLFYSLSDQSLYQRFVSFRKDMPHLRLQEFVVVDYTKQMSILAVLQKGTKEVAIGLGQYLMCQDGHAAEVAIFVRDDYQDRGVGTELLTYLTYLGKRNGLLRFTAEVLQENQKMLHLFEKMGFDIRRSASGNIVELDMDFL